MDKSVEKRRDDTEERNLKEGKLSSKKTTKTTGAATTNFVKRNSMAQTKNRNMLSHSFSVHQVFDQSEDKTAPTSQQHKKVKERRCKAQRQAQGVVKHKHEVSIGHNVLSARSISQMAITEEDEEEAIMKGKCKAVEFSLM